MSSEPKGRLFCLLEDHFLAAREEPANKALATHLGTAITPSDTETDAAHVINQQQTVFRKHGFVSPVDHGHFPHQIFLLVTVERRGGLCGAFGIWATRVRMALIFSWLSTELTDVQLSWLKARSQKTWHSEFDPFMKGASQLTPFWQLEPFSTFFGADSLR